MKTNTSRRNVAGFFPAISWAVILAFLSLTTGGIIAKLSWENLIGFDKLAHAGCYMIFGLLIMHGFARTGKTGSWHILWMIAICSLFGMLMELFQLWMHAGRQFDFLDVLANEVGVFSAYCIFIFCLKQRYHGS